MPTILRTQAIQVYHPTVETFQSFSPMITYASPQPAVQVREKIVDRPVYVDKVVEKVVERIVEKPVYIDKIVGMCRLDPKSLDMVCAL